MGNLNGVIIIFLQLKQHKFNTKLLNKYNAEKYIIFYIYIVVMEF